MMSVAIPLLTLLVKSWPSYVLRASSPKFKSEVVGFFPATADRFILMIGSAI